MKASRLLSTTLLGCLLTLSSLAHSSAFIRPLSRIDSLPAGTRISITIQQPGDGTANKINYVIPAPPKPATIDPLTTPLYDGLILGSRGSGTLITRVIGGKPYVTELLTGGQMLVRGPNILLESSVSTAYGKRVNEFAGGATAFGGLTEPAGVLTPTGYVRKQFRDGAVYYEPGTPTTTPTLPVVPTIPTPTLPITPAPTVPDNNQSNTNAPSEPAGPRGALNRSAAPSRFSAKPYGYNRTTVPHPTYQDGWELKSSEIAVVNAPGFPNETPDALRRSGHTMFDVNWFYGDGEKPFGLPKKEDRLFYEVTGNRFNPYRSVFDVLTNDLQTIGESLSRTLGQFNTVPENGKIDGVGTVKEAHFNLEYTFFTETDNGAGNNWQSLNQDQRNRRFFNYASGREESFQDIYSRGGVTEVNMALHQKWKNIYGLSFMIMNRHSAPLRAYYGDGNGIVDLVSIKDWDRPYPITDLLGGDVNNPWMYGLANEGMNGGRVVLNGNDVYDVSGNLLETAGRSHVYNYEWAVNMSADDFDQYMRVRGSADINRWMDKMVPNLYRPYDRAFHSQLVDYVRTKKGWTDYKVYWQTEPIYENSIWVAGRGEAGAWVPWTLDGPAPFHSCKIPLHPEVSADVVYNARMFLNGLFLWGSYRKQDLTTGKSENTSPELHQLGREGLQIALDDINQYDAFGPDTKRYPGTVQVLNPETGQYVGGDATKLLLANGRRNGLPWKPLPLVTGVYRPSTGVEVYTVYAVHANRYDTTPVKFKSVVDGTELTATAVGWGPVLYSRTTSAR